MSTLTSAVTVAALTAASLRPADEPQRQKPHRLLPASCLTEIGPDPVEPPGRRHALLPTVVLGVDHRPSQTGGIDHRAPFESVSDSDAQPATGRHTYRDRRMTRWTIQLRWSPGTSSRARRQIEPARSPLSPYCRQLLEVHSRPPATLDEALDHWIETSRHRALLDATTRREARDD